MTTIGHNSGNVPGNWVRISRDMRDHPVVGFGMPVKPADPKRGSYSRAEAWLDLIFEARWAAGQVRNMGKVIMLERGQLMAARSWLAARWNWTEQTVRGFLDRLERELMVTRQHNHSKPQERRHFANVLTICNYNIFQTATEILDRLKTNETTNQQPFINHSPTIQQPESKEVRIKEITTVDGTRAFERTRENLDWLEAKLRQAAGGCLNQAAASLCSMADPIRWIENGCNLEVDILPTVAARAQRAPAGRVMSWGFFTQAVADAKAARERPMPSGEAQPGNGPGMPDWKRQHVQSARAGSDAIADLIKEFS
jgi:hypothetical protein